MARRRMDAEDARELILKKGRELFIEKGYSHATMEELRKRCGMSKGNLYYHFQTKDEIFIQVLIRHSEIVMEDFQVRTADLKSAEDKLMILAEVWGEDAVNPFMQNMDEITREINVDEELLAPALAELDKMNQVIYSLINEGMDSGELKQDDPGRLGTAILSILDGTSILCLGLPTIKEENYVAVHRENMGILLEGLKED